jgi:hypothetical protein
MNKREMIHELIDRILDIEESSLKGAHFNYASSVGLDFYFTSRPKSFHSRIANRHDFYTNSNSFDIDKGFKDALAALETMAQMPDKEPDIIITLPESRAIELGLHAKVEA